MKAPTYNELQTALKLAVAMLAHTEPGDSRAVSDEFVALCSVSCGDSSGEVMPVIRRGLELDIPSEFAGAEVQIQIDKPMPAFYAEWTPKPKKEASHART